MTALQFPSEQDGRQGWSESERLVEQRRWAAIAARADGQAEIDARVQSGLLPQLRSDNLLLVEHAAKLAALTHAHAMIENTLSWRITAPLRAMRRITRPRG